MNLDNRLMTDEHRDNLTDLINSMKDYIQKKKEYMNDTSHSPIILYHTVNPNGLYYINRMYNKCIEDLPRFPMDKWLIDNKLKITIVNDYITQVELIKKENLN